MLGSCTFMVPGLWWKVSGGVSQPLPGAGVGFWAEDNCSGVWPEISLRSKGLLPVVMGKPQSTVSMHWDPLDGAHVETCVCCLASPQVTAWGAGVLWGDCPVAGLWVPGRCLSSEWPDPVCSHALKMAASAGLGTVVPWAGGALCSGTRAGGNGVAGTPFVPPHPTAVSSHLRIDPSSHSLLPVPSREIINGVMVTDQDNNELGHSRVSLGMRVQVGVWHGRGSPAVFACRGQQ